MFSETETLVGTSQYPWKTAQSHCVEERPPQSFAELSKQALVESTIVSDFTRWNVTFFLRSFFSENFRYYFLASKRCSSWWKFCLTMVENCRIFTFPQDFVFSFSSKAEPGFPDAHGARHPLALRLVSQNRFGRFVRGLGEEPPSAPLVRSSRRPLLQDQMRGHHQRPLRQGDPSP